MLRLQFHRFTYTHLKAMLNSMFDPVETFNEEQERMPKLNKQFKTSGTWPTLGEAVASNRRLFVFIRSDLVTPDDLGFNKEVTVSLDHPYPPRENGAVRILSNYQQR